MRILIIGPSKLFLSGITYYTICLANALSERNEVAVLQIRKLLPKFLFPGKVRVGEEILDLALLSDIKTYNGIDWFSLKTWISSLKFANNFKPEVVIFQFWTMASIPFYIFFKIFFNKNSKLIVESHETIDTKEENFFILRIFSKTFGRWFLKNLDGYITHSESEKNLFYVRYNISKEKIFVVPHGLYNFHKKIDYNEARRLLGIKDEFMILFFGLVRKYKGVLYLIEAFNILQEDIACKSKLYIVGEIWDDKEQIEEKISRSRFKGHITLIDKYIRDDGISLYFSASDVVVIPYTRSSQSGIATIAMSFGKSIIASEVNGLRECLHRYDGTHFVKPEIPDEIAERLSLLFRMTRRELKPPKDLAWENIAGIYENILEKVYEVKS